MGSAVVATQLGPGPPEFLVDEIDEAHEPQGRCRFRSGVGERPCSRERGEARQGSQLKLRGGDDLRGAFQRDFRKFGVDGGGQFTRRAFTLLARTVRAQRSSTPVVPDGFRQVTGIARAADARPAVVAASADAPEGARVLTRAPATAGGAARERN